jgi:nucleoside-diphosphate-sugar epimerase
VSVEVSIEGKRAVVTGAGGFIGNAVCRRLAAAGAEVVGLDSAEQASARIREAGASPAWCDITDRDGTFRALEDAQLVVHTAAIVSDRGAMADHVRVNVGGTANVLDAAAEGGAERVVHVSSVVVYGYDDPSHQDETSFRRACGVPYIDTKSASDRLACGRGAVVIRPGDVYGPGSGPWAIRPLEMAKAGQLSVPGKGDGVMLPVYIDDLVEAILLGLRQGEPGEAYTAWKDDEQVTFGDFFDLYASMAGGKARRLPRAAMRAAGVAMEAASRVIGRPPPFTRHAVILVDRRGTVSAAKARMDLGWEPQVDLEEGMRRTEEWFRAEGLL